MELGRSIDFGIEQLNDWTIERQMLKLLCKDKLLVIVVQIIQPYDTNTWIHARTLSSSSYINERAIRKTYFRRVSTPA